MTMEGPVALQGLFEFLQALKEKVHLSALQPFQGISQVGYRTAATLPTPFIMPLRCR